MAGERKPLFYIPTLYFVEGLPYTIVNMMSVVFFKSFGASNEFIGLTSFLYIPWVIKLFWAPLVDVYSTRRRWILVSHVVLAILTFMVALASVTPRAVPIALFLFLLIALASATQDVAIDGYYLDVLTQGEQAFFVGVRNAAYKIAWLLGSGGLVFLAGRLAEQTSVKLGWCTAFAICSAMLVLAWAFHSWYLPQVIRSSADHKPQSLTWEVFRKVFLSYFGQPSIIAIVLYILTFRLGDALMLKMAQPFLLDPLVKGGLGISTAEVGLIYGTAGTISLLLGGIIGGWLIASGGLKKWLWPTALLQNSAILLYWLLALAKPGLIWIAVVNSAEQFSYGLGVAAYTVFLLKTVKQDFRAAHYAIATAMMALGMMIPGAASGYLVTWLGYQNFFLISFVAAIPGIITIFFLPLKD